MTTVREQIRNNLVAIISLAVAFAALGYNTWRNERTELNRNIRTAGVELLKEIGSLQQIVFHVRFTDEDRLEDPSGKLRMGWVDVFTINDLAAVMPPDVVGRADHLRSVWVADVAELEPDDSDETAGADLLAIQEADEKARAAGRDAAFQRIDGAIEQLRQATLESLRNLD